MTLLQSMKDVIADNIPGVRYWNARLRHPTQRRLFEVERWVRRGLDLARTHGFSDMCFSDGSAYVVTRNGVQLLYVPGVPHIAHMMELKDIEYEPLEMDVLKRLTASADVVFDIGANAGYHSISLARQYPRLSIHAFEPVPSTYRVLERNVARNMVANQVQCRMLALSDGPGQVAFTADLNTGNHIVSANDDSGRDARTISVQAMSLDAYVAEQSVPTIDGIKCDVEGAELLVLRGADRTLARFRPWLQLEVEDRWTRRFDCHPADVFEFLAARGYDRWVLRRDETVAKPSRDAGQDLLVANNFLFLPQDSDYQRLLAT